jgi:hypothetical protein
VALLLHAVGASAWDGLGAAAGKGEGCGGEASSAVCSTEGPAPGGERGVASGAMMLQVQQVGSGTPSRSLDTEEVAPGALLAPRATLPPADRAALERLLAEEEESATPVVPGAAASLSLREPAGLAKDLPLRQSLDAVSEEDAAVAEGSAPLLSRQSAAAQGFATEALEVGATSTAATGGAPAAAWSTSGAIAWAPAVPVAVPMAPQAGGAGAPTIAGFAPVSGAASPDSSFSDTDAASSSQEIVFPPGHAGLHIHPETGRVEVVEEGGQGQQMGVQVGWTLEAINGQPFNGELLRTTVASGDSYAVTFSKGDATHSGDCAPQCTWKCDSPKCDEVCTPVCRAPRCETRCVGADLSTCTMDCGKAHCAVVCPQRPCPKGGSCPKCTTVCGEPVCKLRCTGKQPCHNVCEEPDCEWKCHAPAQCPTPRCHMVCEKMACATSTYQQLPPLRPGETAVETFSAPASANKALLAQAHAQVVGGPGRVGYVRAMPSAAPVTRL